MDIEGTNKEVEDKGGKNKWDKGKGHMARKWVITFGLKLHIESILILWYGDLVRKVMLLSFGWKRVCKDTKVESWVWPVGKDSQTEKEAWVTSVTGVIEGKRDGA